MAKSTKTRTCKKGYTCGKGCISRSKTCRSNLGPDGQKLVEDYAAFVKRVAAEQSSGAGGQTPEAESSTPTPSPQPSRTQQVNEILGSDASEDEKALALLENFTEGYKQYAESKRQDWEDSGALEGDVFSRFDEREEAGQEGAARAFEKLNAMNLVSEPNQDGAVIDYDIEPLTEFGFTGPDLISQFSSAGEGRLPQETIDRINEEFNGVMLDVSWTVGQQDGEAVDFSDNPRGAIRAALQARKHWKDEIAPNLEPGTILVNQPVGGPKGSRAKAYEKNGFGETSPNDGQQYAIVDKDGKVVPLKTALVDPDKEGILNEKNQALTSGQLAGQVLQARLDAGQYQGFTDRINELTQIVRDARING